MADAAPMSYSIDPTLFLYTSLTAGSSHIITATSRLETILKANKIPFRALDVATDEKARMIWGRRAQGRKLPGLVKFGSVVGDLEEIEEWNEYGELKQRIGAAPEASNASTITPTTTSSFPPTPSDPPSRSASETRHISISEPSDGRDGRHAGTAAKEDTPWGTAMRNAGAEAAHKASQMHIRLAGAVTGNTKEPTAPLEANPTPPVVTEAKLHKAWEDPESSPEMTDTKTPSQLASEGARRTSVDKIAEAEAESSASSDAGDVDTSPQSSTQEQILQLRRSSSISRTKSGLSKHMESSDALSDEKQEAAPAPAPAPAPTPAPEPEVQQERPKEKPDDEGTVAETVAPTETPITDERPSLAMRRHRGSSISEASREEIAEVERRNTIPEEDEGPEEDDDKRVTSGEAVDKEKTTEPSPEAVTQKQEPKDEDAARISVGD